MSAEPIAVRLRALTRASLDQAWATFADTDRFNRLAGLDFRFEFDFTQAGRAQGTGQYRHLGMQLTWREVPVVFEAPRHFAIERLYDSGPIVRALTEMRLTERSEGTQVEMDTLLWPRQPLLRAAVAVDAELTLKPKMTKAFQTLVRALQAGAETPDLAPPALSRAAEAQLVAALPSLHDAEVEAQLAAFLRAAPLVEQARLRPLQLAKRWRLPERQVTAGLLRAARAGLLQVQWEMLCPSCKMPTANPEKLELAKVSAHCPVCDVRYDASFADSIGLSLKPTPAIRSHFSEVRCLSSPARMPHLLGQCQVAPRQEHAWTLDLLPGTYRLRGWPQLEPLVVVVRSEATRHEQSVQAGPLAMSPPIVRLASGRVTLQVRSKLDVPLTLVLERPGVEPATLTVGRLLEWPEVADLLPGGSLDSGMQLLPAVAWCTAVRVERGGQVAEQAAGDAVRALGPRALQVSTGWVLATWPSEHEAVAAVTKLQGTPWLAGALGHGPLLEMFSPDGESGGRRVASGAVLHELTALAQQAEPGQWLALQPAAWPTPLTSLVRTQNTNGTTELRSVTPAAPLPPPFNSQRPLSTGDVLDGRFVIGEQIGQGGFGVVHLAHDRLRNGEVVIKLLRGELAGDPVQVQRFFDEGRLAARLVHPHVVEVHEWGLAEDGRLFVAMERLNGRELGEILTKTRTLDPVRALRLSREALAGLAEAHRQGLVHRDIKPANLFVVGEGTPSESCKVIDFGIALDLTGQVGSPEQAGQVIGTPMYMAPEQVRGEPLDGRCDIYAMGIVLYQTLTGGLPFVGDTVMALLVARLVQAPRPLGETCGQPLPHGVAALVERALALDPKERPASAAIMASELERLLAGAGNPARWKQTWQDHAASAATAELPYAPTALDSRRGG